MVNPVGRPPVMRNPGKYLISNDEYHQDPYYISSSQIKEALISPAHFKHYVMDRRSKKKSTPSMDKGSLVHTVVLEPHLIDVEYVIHTGEVTTTGLIPAKARENYAKAYHGKTIVTKADYEQAQKVRSNFENYPAANELLFGEGCEYEPSYFIQCPETGLKLRVRPDCINLDKGYIVDLKTTKARDKYQFKKDALYTFNYDLSAFMYCKVIYDLTGVACKFFWATAGNEDMCPTAIYRVSDATMDSGKTKFYKAIDNIKSALLLPDDYRFQMTIEEM